MIDREKIIEVMEWVALISYVVLFLGYLLVAVTGNLDAWEIMNAKEISHMIAIFWALLASIIWTINVTEKKERGVFQFFLTFQLSLILLYIPYGIVNVFWN